MAQSVRRILMLAAVALVVGSGWSCSAAGPSIVAADDSHLTASAQSTVIAHDTVRYLTTSASVTNRGVLPVHLEYGACTVRVLAYRDESRSGAPIWNSDYREPYHSSVKYGCTLQLILQDLQPAQSLDFGFSSPLIELVGDSLPNGRYYLSADLRIANTPAVQHIPAGSVDVELSHPRR
jgi:hypothetical protein